MSTLAAIRAAEEEARRAPTERQAEVLAWIRDFVAKQGFPPTVREIGAAFGFSFANASLHLKALDRKGLLRVDFNVARGIKLVAPQVPIVFGVPESVCGVLDRIERRGAQGPPLRDRTHQTAAEAAGGQLMRRPYRNFATAFLEAMIAIYKRIDVGGLFRRSIAEMDLELTLRQMEDDAVASGAFVVSPILGEQ